MAEACVECGTPLAASSHGRTERCKPCANKMISQAKSAKLAEQDEWLLKMCLTRPVSTVAKQMGLSRSQIYNRIASARARKAAASA